MKRVSPAYNLFIALLFSQAMILSMVCPMQRKLPQIPINPLNSSPQVIVQPLPQPPAPPTQPVSQYTVEPVQGYKRMILLFDKDAEGSAPDKQQALAATFAINLHQKASPVIISYSALVTFLELRYSGNPPASSEVYQKTKKLCQLVTFNLIEWNIYYCKNSQFFFFAPKTMTWITDKEVVKVGWKETYFEVSLPVFNMDKDKIELFQSTKTNINEVISDLFAWTASKYNQSSKVEISPLETLFFNADDIARDNDIKQKIEAFYSEKKIDPFKEEQGDWIKNDDARAALILSYTKPWDIFIQGHGSYGEQVGQTTYTSSVAGLEIQQLQALLLFLNSINTNLAALSSCYSGGKNLDYMQFKRELAQSKTTPKLNYILAVISSGDLPSTTSYYFLDTPPFKLTGGIDFEKFFDACEHRTSLNWLTDAVRYLARFDQEVSAENVPQILIPHGGWFQAFTPKKQKILTPSDESKELQAIELKLKETDLTEIQKDVLERRKKFLIQPGPPPVETTSPIQIIGNVLLKKYEILDKPIEIKEKDVVLLYPEIIPIPLKISPTAKGFPMVLSMIKGDAVHVIDSVELLGTANELEAFVNSAFFTLKGRRAKKTFLIKTLICKEGTLNQVFIQSWIDIEIVEVNGKNEMHFITKLRLRYNLVDKYFGYDFDDKQVPANFSSQSITEVIFNNDLKILAPSLQTIEKKLDDIKNPKDYLGNPDPHELERRKLSSKNWMIKNKMSKDQITALRKAGQLAQSELQKRLIIVRNKLEKLHNNLTNLSNGLKRLRSTLKPQPVTPKSQKLAGQLKGLAEQGVKQKACYDLLNGWIKTPPTDSGKDMQDKLLALGKNFSALFTDSKINFVDAMIQKLSRDSLRVILAGLFTLISSNQYLTKDEATYIELAAVSITIWKALNSFSGTTQAEVDALVNEQQTWDAAHGTQAWFNNIVNYYQKKQSQLSNLGLLKTAKSLHFFAAQLCIFFAAIQIGGIYQTLYIWIKNALPMLQMSDDHKLEIVRSIVSFEQANAGTPEFIALVQALTTQYLNPAQP